MAVIREATAHKTMVARGRLGSGQPGAGDRARALWQRGLLGMLGVDWFAGFLIDELLAQPTIIGSGGRFPLGLAALAGSLQSKEARPTPGCAGDGACNR